MVAGKERLEYGAPFSRLLWMISVLATVLLILVPVIGLVLLPPGAPGISRILLTIVPLLVLAGALPFMIRGYRIEPRCLLIRRLGWSTRVSLDELESADVDSTAMKYSLRLMGNGGLFSFTGLYWNRRLGRYRAFVTDPSRAVVLKLGGRTVLVSPDSPDDFARALRIVRSRA